MKKLFALLLALTMIFALAACGGGKSGSLAWPGISYLQGSDKYTGDGKITYVKEWTASAEYEKWTIFYEGATFESVESYVAGLVNTGWENNWADEESDYAQAKTDEGIARGYYCTSDYAEIEIQITDYTLEHEFSDEVPFTYNLRIDISKTYAAL